MVSFATEAAASRPRPSSSMPSSRRLTATKSTLARASTRPRENAKDIGEARKPKAEATPAPIGTTTLASPSFMAMCAACTGPAPPIGTIV
jgi:hypothetical protein